MTTDEQIQMYLDDNDLLLKDWHTSQMQNDTGIDDGECIGIVDDIQKAFIRWTEGNKLKLRERICPNIEKIKSLRTPSLIINFIIGLIEDLSIVAKLVVAVATLLFKYGIDNLCKVDEI